MYREILENLSLTPELEKEIEQSHVHLGVFTEPVLTYMLEGKKTIESRFSKHKISPYQNISKGDYVFVKKSSGKIVAYFKVKEVLFFDFNKTPIDEVKEKYKKELCVDDTFWKAKKDSRYATLMVIEKLTLLNPFSIHKKGMQSWIKLT